MYRVSKRLSDEFGKRIRSIDPNWEIYFETQETNVPPRQSRILPDTSVTPYPYLSMGHYVILNTKKEDLASGFIPASFTLYEMTGCCGIAVLTRLRNNIRHREDETKFRALSDLLSDMVDYVTWFTGYTMLLGTAVYQTGSGVGWGRRHGWTVHEDTLFDNRRSSNPVVTLSKILNQGMFTQYKFEDKFD